MSFFLEVCDDLQQFTSFATQINLADGATYPGAKARGHARSIYVDDAGSGTLAVKMAGSGGTTRTLTVAAGRELIGKFMSIETSTNCARVTVGW